MHLVNRSTSSTQDLLDLAERLWVQHGVNARHFVAEQIDQELEADDKVEYAAWVNVSLILVEISLRSIKTV